MHKKNVLDLTLPQLQQTLTQWQYQLYHAEQIFSWLYKKGIKDFAKMSDLPIDLRKLLEGAFSISGLHLVKALKSLDGTQKLLFRLKDNYLIEGVSIPAKNRVTGCVSTQVGCKFSCSFCASAVGGFKRNLTAGEIVEEILLLKEHSPDKKLTHIVFMGTGEPLDNYENVIKAIRIINSPQALHIGARRITISTCGIIPGIKRLTEEGLQIELSVSLHAADDRLRAQIMPINKKYPLKGLINACKKYMQKTSRQITFEYILVKGLNSDLQNCQNLSKILKGLKLAKVNLIPANPIQELGVQSPAKAEIVQFRDCLLKQGINATLRTGRGQDIQAACGQLRLSYEKK